MDKNLEEILNCVKSAFKNAYASQGTLKTNANKSAYFVSELAKNLLGDANQSLLVQSVDKYGKKTAGEWLLDIIIADFLQLESTYRKRRSEIINKIYWAVESEFSTSLHEFSRDFAKLLHVKSENYLYIAGLNQVTVVAKEAFKKAQLALAERIVKQQEIQNPFYLAFVPSPAKSTSSGQSLWAKDYTELESWIEAYRLN